MARSGFVKAKEQIKMTPGSMLRTLREIDDLTQKELSELTGISQSNLFRFS